MFIAERKTVRQGRLDHVDCPAEHRDVAMLVVVADNHRQDGVDFMLWVPTHFVSSQRIGEYIAASTVADFDLVNTVRSWLDAYDRLDAAARKPAMRHRRPSDARHRLVEPSSSEQFEWCG
ncbi:hypothetical protein [Amycolatopsis rubida]|uniref:hypothetical protein n=1 Tax=Amycolatopsis rubida TaxID=112413 RepID=UPI00116072BE|nr:hypothetical protein [Amycolatopsis rubida]